MLFNMTRWLFRHKWVVAVGLVGLALMACRLVSHPTRADQYILLTSDEYHWPEEHIFAVLPDGSRLTRLGKGFNPSCSPDGRRIAFAAPVGTFLPDGGNPYTQIFVMDADGSNVKQLTFGDGYNDAPMWSPDGQRLAFPVDGGIAIMDLNTLKVTYLNLGRYADCPAWSPNGQRLVFYRSGKQGENGLYVVNADGSNLTRLTNGHDREPDWSPDGRHIVFLHGDNISSLHTLRVVESDGSNPVDILPEEQLPRRWSPKWSPDGQQIIFGRHYLIEAMQEWRDGVFMVNADGSGLRLVIQPGGDVWGRDGGGLLPLLRGVTYGRLDWCKVR